MKSLFLKITACCAVLFLAACENDLNITDDWQETPVVYALLNPSSTVNYVRLQRAYLGQGNAYLMGQYSDSLYFDTNQVSVRVLRIKNGAATDTFHLPVVTSIKKDEGVFADAPHYLYQMNGRIYPDSRYRLLVNRHVPVGSRSITATSGDIFSAGAAAQQHLIYLSSQELEQSGLKDGNLLHSLGFLVTELQSGANYSVSVAASLTGTCLDPSALPSFSTVLNSETMSLHKGWNDLFFKNSFAVSPGSGIVFRICINPQSTPGSATLAFTETSGCTSFASSSTCGSATALTSESRRPVVRVGFSGNGLENSITSAETELVYPFYSQTLSSGLNVNLANSEPFKIKVTSSQNGSVHAIDVRFRYLERKVNEQVYTEKSVIYPLGNITPVTSSGGEAMEFLMYGDQFFQYLRSQIPNDPGVVRPGTAAKLDFIARIGTPAFNTYYIVNQPGNSVFNQPDFTNVENGKGIFTSRLDSTRANFLLNSPSTDTLNFGRFTGELFN